MTGRQAHEPRLSGHSCRPSASQGLPCPPWDRQDPTTSSSLSAACSHGSRSSRFLPPAAGPGLSSPGAQGPRGPAPHFRTELSAPSHPTPGRRQVRGCNVMPTPLSLQGALCQVPPSPAGRQPGRLPPWGRERRRPRHQGGCPRLVPHPLRPWTSRPSAPGPSQLCS